MAYASLNRVQIQDFLDTYVAKHRAVGSAGSYESAHLALQMWLERGYTFDAAMRRIRAKSVLNTLQEQQVGLPNEEWRILVVCIMLNMTHGRQVRPMIEAFFGKAPGPLQLCQSVKLKGLTDLTLTLKPLGFANRRVRTIVALSDTILSQNLPPEHVSSGSWAAALPGVGPYALDSLDIFRYGSLRTTCTDTWLNNYVKWRIANDLKNDG